MVGGWGELACHLERSKEPREGASKSGERPEWFKLNALMISSTSRKAFATPIMRRRPSTRQFGQQMAGMFSAARIASVQPSWWAEMISSARRRGLGTRL